LRTSSGLKKNKLTAKMSGLSRSGKAHLIWNAGCLSIIQITPQLKLIRHIQAAFAKDISQIIEGRDKPNEN